MKHPAFSLFFALPLLLSGMQEKEQVSPFPNLEKPAPTFRLNDHEAELVAIGGPQKHWTVLAFFPKAMTPG